MSFFRKIIQFIKDVAHDERIPQKDKRLVLAMLTYLASPLDLIPDWIPLVGLLDDLIVLALILDYFFEVLDQDLILSHYPWGLKSYLSLRKGARFLTWLVPRNVKEKLWNYQPDIYKH